MNYTDWENSDNYIVYKINFYKDMDLEWATNEPTATYIGSCRGRTAHKRWRHGLTRGNSRSYNKAVLDIFDNCDLYTIDVIARDLSLEQARILEYTLINHNKGNLNVRKKPDCEFKIIKE